MHLHLKSQLFISSLKLDFFSSYSSALIGLGDMPYICHIDHRLVKGVGTIIGMSMH